MELALIKSAAYFEISRDHGGYGHIVYQDGRRSGPYFDREEALAQSFKDEEEGLITREERMALDEQIKRWVRLPAPVLLPLVAGALVEAIGVVMSGQLAENLPRDPRFTFDTKN